MTRVRVDLMVSLDGFVTTTDQTPENPFGQDWSRLTGAYGATRTFRSRVLGDTSGEGTTGIDDAFAAAHFEGIGAEILGAGMFGFHNFPNDPDWKGWWGDEPPFGVPVFVLTHRRKEPLVMKGGTTFHFIDTSPQEALALAKAAAGDLDVRIGGGPTTVRPFLEAGLIDDLHLAIAPIVLGSGIRIWDGLRGFENERSVTTVVAESGTIHLTLRRPADGPRR
jgi:dihydrofolate reductase